ncbi:MULTISPECIES: polysaccharide biosynthesis tyrosine autokinase [unclassified Acinetobacter]|uniref:polysaccharide biosynthesis tyrosine autokinase n=1 Tax=unclassified Acinetobacter TaxID=196816 RepID=UPI0029352182|nr:MULTISPECIES: polysaccharide biosynthesis tyrosine autokinase [unclassified Acinetobacter]WOE30877.1 polysaccharide biosynthesis tyrosine autokinase [Acinetobacter sp. SAAs470]WOE39072.1 polysaccharide biosynthesis tyrosine autokinase [Acinetobacter sp. SAAs474]
MSANTNTEDTIDLKALFFSLIAQWKLISLCILLSLVCALLYLRVTPETYQVNALVQVSEGKNASSALLGDLSSVIDQKQPAQAEIEILKSRLVLGNAIQRLNLDTVISGTQNSVLYRLFSPHDYQTEYSQKLINFSDNNKSFQIRKFSVSPALENQPLLLTFNQGKIQVADQKTEQVLGEISLNQPGRISTPDGVIELAIYSQDSFDQSYIIRKLSLPAAVDRISSNFSVAEKGKLTGILSLNYEGRNPAHIRQVLNAILVAYHQQNIERSSAETSQTLNFLDEQLPELKAQLDQAERQFNYFREQYNTVDINKESELYLSQSVALETQKANLEQEVAEAGAKYTADHPVMQQMTAQLASINEKQAKLEQTLKQLPDLQRRYLQLYREVEVKNQLYTNLLNSYQQLRIAKAGEIGNIRIVDNAVNPLKPIKPKKLSILVLALFLGGFIGTLLALLRNMMRSGIKDTEQLETEFSLPVYATIPHSPVQFKFSKLLKKKKSLPILAVHDSEDISIESLRSMRTALYFTTHSAKNNVISISAPAPGIGKSFVSINLSTILAQNNKRILLIDADMRRSYLYKYCNLDNSLGLSSYLLGERSLQDVIRPTAVNQFDIITSGPYPKNPTELLHSEKFAEIFEQLSAQYDYIIVDTPPILAVTDASIIAKHAGTNLMVISYGKTELKEIKLSLSRFTQVGSNVDGFILNNITQHSARYAYQYNYKYTSHKDQ